MVRRIARLALVAVLLALVGVVSQASAQFGTTTFFSGCLTNRGTLTNVVTNTATPPTSPTCLTGETLVSWNDGPTYTAGTGLNLTGGAFSVNFSGSGSANTAARSDHTHTLADGEVTTAKLAGNAVTGAKIANITRTMIIDTMQNVETMLATVGTTAIDYNFVVPADYAGGDIVVREWWQPHDNSGLARLDRAVNKLSPGQASASFIGTTNHDFCCDNQRVWTLSAASIAAGDIVHIQVIRYGSDGSDTLGRLAFWGGVIEYWADQ